MFSLYEEILETDEAVFDVEWNVLDVTFFGCIIDVLSADVLSIEKVFTELTMKSSLSYSSSDKYP